MVEAEGGGGFSPASGGLFRAVFEQAPLGVQVRTRCGETVAINRVWEALWGGTLEQLGGSNILEDP